MTATDLPAKGGSGSRDDQSKAFFKTSEKEWLYSGVTTSSASAAAMA